MAITALGLGTKGAPANTNLDPQRQFWSWLSAFKNPDELGDSGHHERAYFSGFACTQATPAGMSIQIGGGDDVDSAAIFIDSDRAVLLSTDGTPETVTIPTAPASGSRIDAVVSYIDTTSPDPESETPGTPEYVHTIVVSGTASSSPSAPTDAQIVSALPAGANSKYYRWCDVRVAQGTTTITNSNITDRKPDAPEPYWTEQDIQDVASPKKASTTVTYAYGYQVRCERYGDVVCLIMNDSTGSGTLPKSGSGAEKLPVGYRPTASVGTVCRYGATDTAGTPSDLVGFITINTNGTCDWAFSRAPAGMARWTWSISYTTNNAFPD